MKKKLKLNNLQHRYPVVDAKEEGLDNWFKNNPYVTGMAIGAGANGITGPRRIVHNPYSKIIPWKWDPRWKGLDKIETVRHDMDEMNYKPNFQLSPEQRILQNTPLEKGGVKGTIYETDDNAFKQSIMSRIIAGDTINLGITPEQINEYKIYFKNKYSNGGELSDEQYYNIMRKVAEENNPKWNDWRTKEGESKLSVEQDYKRLLNSNDYDYRGYYNKYPESAANADTHWPDEFKTAWHPTFSVESRYSGVKNSKYNPLGLPGGFWLGDIFIPRAWQFLENKDYYKPKYQLGGFLRKLVTRATNKGIDLAGKALVKGTRRLVKRHIKTPKITLQNAASMTPELWDATLLYISKTFGNESKLMLALADAKYKSTVPINEMTIDTNDNPQLWVHGTRYGGHSTFNSSVLNATIGGESAHGKVKGNFFARDASNGSYPGGGITAANNYAGSSGNIPTASLTQPITWIEKLKNKLGLFKPLYIHPVDRVKNRVDVTRMHQYEKPIIDLMNDEYKVKDATGRILYPFLENVVYPTYINPGKTLIVDFKGKPWSLAPIKYPNKYSASYNYATFEAAPEKEFRVKPVQNSRMYNQNLGEFNTREEAIAALLKKNPDLIPNFTVDYYTGEPSDYTKLYLPWYEIRKGNKNIPTGIKYIDDAIVREVNYPLTTNGVVLYGASEGYDSILMKNVIDANTRGAENFAIDDLVPLSSKLIKLATPSTYDNNGNLIPMSKRFDWSNSDIRYGLIPFVGLAGLTLKNK